MKHWADSAQAFLLRVMSSLFITSLLLHCELALFSAVRDTYEIVCVNYWPGLVIASAAAWFGLHLLIYRKN